MVTFPCPSTLVTGSITIFFFIYGYFYFLTLVILKLSIINRNIGVKQYVFHHFPYVICTWRATRDEVINFDYISASMYLIQHFRDVFIVRNYMRPLFTGNRIQIGFLETFFNRKHIP